MPASEGFEKLTELPTADLQVEAPVTPDAPLPRELEEELQKTKQALKQAA